MYDERPNSRPGSRDVVGAWLLCVALALLGLGLTNHAQSAVPAAAEITGLSPCGSASACALAADVDAHGTRTVAGLHRLNLRALRHARQARAG